MFRYMSLVWSVGQSEQDDTAVLISRRIASLSPQWYEAFNESGLRVFCADPHLGSLESHLLADAAGVILGAIFQRDHHPEHLSQQCQAKFPTAATGSII
jgi:hypothetical protein